MILIQKNITSESKTELNFAIYFSIDKRSENKLTDL